MFRGNIVMKGYLKNAKATAEAFAGGWFHTGDLAVLEADRYVKIKDRSKDVIISGGENISSLEVEDALYRHPAVLACAVVARPDPKWGETPLAFVELKAGRRRHGRRAGRPLPPAARRLQGAARDPLRGDPEDLDRQDPEVPAARAGPLGGGDRIDDERESAMNDRAATELTPFVRRGVDERGVVTLTLDRPQSFNALSEGMLAALQAELDAVAADETARVVVIAADGKAFCAGHDLKEMRAEPSLRVLRGAVRAVRAHDAGDPAPAGAGDRARAGHRHRGRLPARRRLRPRGRRRQRALRRERRQPRPLLLVAERRAVAQPRAQGGVRDARHRRVHLRRGSARQGASSTASPRPRRSTPRSSRWSRRSSPSRASRSRWARQLFYRQLESGIDAAYEDAGRTMACNMMDEAALEGVQAFIDKRKPAWPS